jgi:uncharacterized membrane protein YgcG
LIKSHANTNDALTLPALRAAFLLQYNDVRRHTEQEVRDRLFAGEHYMKSGERVGEYTQRFRDIIRDAPSMTQIEMITWYVHGLPQAMRKWCATDASGRDWERLDDLIKFALGQEVRSRIASLKTASLNFVSTPRNKIAKKQNRKPPPRAPITCRDCGLTVRDIADHKSSGTCDKVQQLAGRPPRFNHNERKGGGGGRGFGGGGMRGRFGGGRGGRGQGGQGGQGAAEMQE